MKILSIETSCDETGISLLEGNGNSLTILGNSLASQVELHAQYGGVFPAMAKRAHAEKIIPLLINTLSEATLLEKNEAPITEEMSTAVREGTVKDISLQEPLLTFLEKYKKPSIDYIAVTTGPGLEPALWVGITVAKILSIVWNIPLLPINHMEGHVLVALLDQKTEQLFELIQIQFPSLALLVSGGHTELVLITEYGQYEKIGSTRDDAVGEAFDKVARMLGLPYPGGPAISKLAAGFREKNIENLFTLPRPMLHSGDYDFSFSGIKTAVLYTLRDLGEISESHKEMISCAFEDACIEVLVSKTIKAAKEYGVNSIIVGGGVAGNTYLKQKLTEAVQEKTLASLLFPKQWLATDNSVMIGVAGYMQVMKNNIPPFDVEKIKADGSLSITSGGVRK